MSRQRDKERQGECPKFREGKEIKQLSTTCDSRQDVLEKATLPGYCYGAKGQEESLGAENCTVRHESTLF